MEQGPGVRSGSSPETAGREQVMSVTAKLREIRVSALGR